MAAFQHSHNNQTHTIPLGFDALIVFVVDLSSRLLRSMNPSPEQSVLFGWLSKLFLNNINICMYFLALV
jgi:hypothetical protein